MNSTKKTVVISLMIALEILFTGVFKIETQFIKVTFGFLPLSLIAILFGPLYAGIACALTDLICFFLFPSGFPFFIGYTVSCFLAGLVYGAFLYKKPVTIIRILIPVCIVSVFINLGLNTFWLHVTYGRAFLAMLPSRIIKNISMIPVQVILIKLAWEYLPIKKMFDLGEVVRLRH